MTLPFSLPDWVPWWLPFLVLVPGLLYLLAFFLMPFSVFGVKGRLEAMEARLDEIHAEVRQLALRLPEPLRGGGYGEDLAPLHTADGRQAGDARRPPIPPAPPPPVVEPVPGALLAATGRKPGPEPGMRSPRTEPRLDWPD
jgi:hypothetical protein